MRELFDEQYNGYYQNTNKLGRIYTALYKDLCSLQAI